MGEHSSRTSTRGAADGADKTVALLPFGDLFDDFLDSIGVSLETFCAAMTGGWLFGYVEAMKAAGVRAVIVIVSARVATPTRATHGPTLTTIWILPPLGIYRALRGFQCRARRLPPLLVRALGEILPYLATPPRGIARVMRREGCDAILCQEYEYPRFDVCVLLGWLLRLPVVATFQGGDWQRGRLERAFRPLTVHAAAKLIVAPESEARRVCARYHLPSRNVARIFNPLDPHFYADARRDPARRALDIPDNARVAIWHGRVAMHAKGLDLLLDAWAHVCREHPGRDLRLLLVGTGEDAPVLRRCLAAGPPGVRWVDEYLHDRAAIRQYLVAADVYAFASRHEGFPVAPIEAMACGLPVVATAVPGISDILAGGEDAGGVLVPPDDAAAFARALGRVLDNEDWGRELGERARGRVADAFSLEAVGVQLRTLVEASAKAQRGPSHTRSRPSVA